MPRVNLEHLILHLVNYQYLHHLHGLLLHGSPSLPGRILLEHPMFYLHQQVQHNPLYDLHHPLPGQVLLEHLQAGHPHS